MKNPLITMSAITGRPSKEKIFEYLKGLKEYGIEQVMIYPRSGCEIEYLSEEWFKTIDNFVGSANELDMNLWLYDDFNWPSGDANGRVTKIEEFRLKAIKISGDEIGEITSKSRHNSGLFGEKYFPNLLSWDAVDYFIKCTHEEYYKRFGKYFGKVIKGIFTDEPSIGYCCESDSIPYYDSIEKDYKNFCGRNFKDDMLSGDDNFYSSAIEVISNRFNKCYISKLESWCKEHGLLMTGHLMCDNDPAHATKHGGHFLKNLSSFSIPGIDEIFTNLEDTSEMTLFGACEYASGENGAMAELFALGPADISYAKRKCMIFLASAFKIDHYFLAISHLDMRGNLLVCDFFNNFNTDQPDFKGMRLLASEAKKASLLAKKDFTPDVYIRYPFKQCVSTIRKNRSIESLWHLVNELTYKGVQWKFIDDEKVNDAPVIEINDNLEYTLCGKGLDMSLVQRKITIEDKAGNPQKGIFVRQFNDGSILILNLFAPAGEYKINGNLLYLDKYAVITSYERAMPNQEEIAPTFKVKYCNDNIIRTMHLNSQENAEIYANCDTGVTFCLRNGEKASLNGKELKCQNETTVLSNGMKELYKMTSKITLEKGANIIKAQNDFKYLPTAFLCGDFSYEIISGDICKLILGKRKEEYTIKSKLYDFGKIELSTKIIVPKGALEIELQGTDLYTLVYLDNTLLGEKITAPYKYKLDSSLWNESVELKIVQYSSIAPIFGDVDYWDKNAEKSGWRGTPSPKPHSFGFEGLFWNFQ